MIDPLAKQIAAEHSEIENAVKIPLRHLTGNVGRCHFCGRISQNLIEVERFTQNGQTIIRYKGAECCGGKNG